MTSTATALAPNDALSLFQSVREQSEDLAAPLVPEDVMLLSMEESSRVAGQ